MAACDLPVLSWVLRRYVGMNSKSIDVDRNSMFESGEHPDAINRCSAEFGMVVLWGLHIGGSETGDWSVLCMRRRYWTIVYYLFSKWKHFAVAAIQVFLEIEFLTGQGWDWDGPVHLCTP